MLNLKSLSALTVFLLHTPFTAEAENISFTKKIKKMYSNTHVILCSSPKPNCQISGLIAKEHPYYVIAKSIHFYGISMKRTSSPKEIIGWIEKKYMMTKEKYHRLISHRKFIRRKNKKIIERRNHFLFKKMMKICLHENKYNCSLFNNIVFLGVDVIKAYSLIVKLHNMIYDASWPRNMFQRNFFIFASACFALIDQKYNDLLNNTQKSIYLIKMLRNGSTNHNLRVFTHCSMHLNDYSYKNSIFNLSNYFSINHLEASMLWEVYQHQKILTVSSSKKYVEILYKKIERNFNPPQSIPSNILALCKKNIKIILYLNKIGNLIHVKIEKKSGNDLFDRYMLLSFLWTSPYPYPSKQLWAQIKDGIEISW